MSLVNNYRARFNQDHPVVVYWELVQRMEKKTVPEPKTSSAGS